MDNERAVRIAKDVETLLETEGAVGFMYTAIFPDKEDPEKYSVVQGITTESIAMTAAMNDRIGSLIKGTMSTMEEAMEYLQLMLELATTQNGKTKDISKDVHDEDE